VEGSCEHGDEPSGSLKLLGVSGVAARWAASQEWLSSVNKYVSKLHIYYCPRVECVPIDEVLDW
jgi:hypothetical protein